MHGSGPYSTISVLRRLAGTRRSRPARWSPASKAFRRIHADLNWRRFWCCNSARHGVPVRGPDGGGLSRCLTGPWSPGAAPGSVAQCVINRARQRFAVVPTWSGPAIRRESACRWFISGMGAVLPRPLLAQVEFLRRGRLGSSSRPWLSALFHVDAPDWSAVPANQGHVSRHVRSDWQPVSAAQLPSRCREYRRGR